MSQTNAAILAVGSELLSGQIVNRNAAWLSDRLFAVGIDTSLHLTVDDVEAEIVAGLASAAAVADLIIVTGGLGPTSDDLTRNAVASWAGAELVFDQASWDRIGAFFQRLTRDVPESNRQQCYFPKSATVLTNKSGTANGFTLKTRGKEVWVLPGPPHEVETIWNDHIEAALTGRIPLQNRRRLRKWRTIGKGESHLAELIEPLVAGKGVDVAYRAHAPYVELKVRFPEAEAERCRALCDDIHAALKPWLYEIDDQDVPKLLVERLLHYKSVDIYDGATQGHVLELLAPYLRASVQGPAFLSSVTSWESHDTPAVFVDQALDLGTDTELSLAVAGVDASGTWAVGIRKFEDKTVDEHPSLYRGDAMRSRNMKALAALAAKAWYDALSGENLN